MKKLLANRAAYALISHSGGKPDKRIQPHKRPSYYKGVTMLKITVEAENMTKNEYDEALALVGALMDYDPPKVSILGDLLSDVVDKVEAYEKEHYPI